MDNKKPSNQSKAEYYKIAYHKWKKEILSENQGFFPIFNDFKDTGLLSEISGGALKLYLFLGLFSGNFTGETWVTIESMSTYFDKSPRTITNWINELTRLGLIERMQLELNGKSHTYLRPYGLQKKI